MTDYSLFLELARDLSFGEEDAALLKELGPVLAPRLSQVVDEFYAVIAKNPSQRAVFETDEQLRRQKGFLLVWMEELFCGVYDDAYFQKRRGIGRAHVRIRLPARYMVSMMGVVRSSLMTAIQESAGSSERSHQSEKALAKLLDLELATMLETYREDYDHREATNTRLATLGQLAASIGHELRNPLAVIESSAHLLGRSVSPNDAKAAKHLHRIEAQVKRSGKIISDLLELARDKVPHRESVSLGELHELALGEISPEAKNLQVHVDGSEVEVEVDANQIAQVIQNLVANALEAASQQVLVRISTEADELVLCVEDDGPGLNPEARKRLFEPLFTTKVTGIGLGLWLSKRIIERHDGTVHVTNADPHGARFVVRIPGGVK